MRGGKPTSPVILRAQPEESAPRGGRILSDRSESEVAFGDYSDRFAQDDKEVARCLHAASPGLAAGSRSAARRLRARAAFSIPVV